MNGEAHVCLDVSVGFVRLVRVVGLLGVVRLDVSAGDRHARQRRGHDDGQFASLISHADGFSGTWLGARRTLSELRQGAPGGHGADVAGEWSPDIRAQIIANEVSKTLSLRVGSGVLQASIGGSTRFALALPADTAAATTAMEQLLAEQLRIVYDYRDLRAERNHEIGTELEIPEAYWSSILSRPIERMPHTMQWIGAALDMTARVTVFLKSAIALPRPSQLSPQIQPSAPIPGTAPSPAATPHSST